MENSNYLIIIAIKEGDNFPVSEICLSSNNVKSQTSLLIEARFNDEVLRSDLIPYNSCRPQLNTELAYQIDRKSLHLFRIERKPIKLQCFVVSADHCQRQLIGYMILDLRNAQDTLSPKFEWKTLLNQKYRGSSHQRPQLSIALVLTKCGDDDKSILNGEVFENSDVMTHFNAIGNEIGDESPVGSDVLSMNEPIHVLTENMSKASLSSQDLENDLSVQLINGHYHIWDSRHSNDADCTEKFIVSFTIVFAENLRKLFLYPQKINDGKLFHFRYTFLGAIIKTELFDDIDKCDFSVERTSFKIATTDISILKAYFELHPTIEVQFCDRIGNLFGFVSIPLTNFHDNTANESFDPIQGSFMLLPSDELINIDEPYPVIGVSIELNKESVNEIEESLNPQLKSPQRKRRVKEKSNSVDNERVDIKTLKSSDNSINHFCFSIDLRTIRVTDTHLLPIDSCYLQYSYAFFDYTDSIKTYPPIKLETDSDVIIPHGFCSFNFATTEAKLEKTFRNIPLMIEIIETNVINTFIGTARIELSHVLDAEPNGSDKIHISNCFVPVLNEENNKIAQIQVIMSLENLGLTEIPQTKKLADVSVSRPNIVESPQFVKNIDELLMEAALEIELWKDKQLIMFREELKNKESQFSKKFDERLTLKENELRKKLEDVNELELKLKNTIKEMDEKEKSLQSKESEVNEMRKELGMRFQKLNDEISNAMHDIKDQYERRIGTDKEKFKDIENEKRKLQERNYFLERKLKEKDNKIKELELINERKTVPKVTNSRYSSTVKSNQMSSDVSPKKVPLTGRNHINGTLKSPNVNSVERRSHSVGRTQPENLFTNSNATKIASKIVGKEINKKDNTKSQNKMEILTRLKIERDKLINEGISKYDPLIKEVDEKLKKYLL